MHLLKGFLFAAGGALLIANASLFATAQVAATAVNAPLNMGSANVCPKAQTTPTPCSQTATMTFKFTAGGSIAAPSVVTQGAPNLDFTDAKTGTCIANQAYNTGNTCTVNVTFKPLAPGTRYGAVELLDASGNLLATGYVHGIGVGPLVNFGNSTAGVYSPSHQFNLGPSPRELLGTLGGLALDGSGNIFTTDIENSFLYEVAAAGGYNTVKFVMGYYSGLLHPHGLALDGAGNIFLADTDNDVVKEIVAAGGYSTVKSVGKGFLAPEAVAVDGSGNVFVADRDHNAVKKILAADGYTTVKGLFKYTQPTYMAVDGNGNVFLADPTNNTLKEYAAAGGYTTVKNLDSGYNRPAHLAVDGSGNLFIEHFGGPITEMPATDAYTSVKTVDSSAGGVMAVDGRGNIYLAGVGSLVKLDFANPPSLTFAPTNIGLQSSDSPQMVTVSNNGNAELTFPVPSSGDNPVLEGAGFALDSATTCPRLSYTDSTGGNLALGASCVYALDFSPVEEGTVSGSLKLRDNHLNASPAGTHKILLTGPEIPAHLAFTTPPPGTLDAGRSPGPVIVSVEGSDNKAMNSASGTITLTVSGPWSYSAVYTATALAGVATFSSLAQFDRRGTYTYTATDVPDGFTQAVATQYVDGPQLGVLGPFADKLPLGRAPGIVQVVSMDSQHYPVTLGTITLTVTGPKSYSKVYSAVASSAGVATFDTLETPSVTGKYVYRFTDTPDRLDPWVEWQFVKIFRPIGWLVQAIDSTTGGTTVGQSDAVFITGWAVDFQPRPLTQVQILIDGNAVGNATIGRYFPTGCFLWYCESDPAHTHSRWKFTTPASGLSLGSHTVTAIATNAYNLSTTLNSLTFTVAATSTGPPIGWIDRAIDAATGTNTVGQSGQVLITGYAADPQHGAPVSQVQILIDGLVAGDATLGLIRTEIAAKYNNPAYTSSGWKFTASAAGLSLGTHTVSAIVRDSLGLSTTLNQKTFTVAATSTGPPIGWLDKAVDSTTGAATVARPGKVLITGWAADPQQGAPVTQVQILIDGNAVGNAALGWIRSDIAAYYNNPAYKNSGWRFTTAASGLSLGTHTVSAIVTDSLGVSTTLNSKTFTLAATSTGPPVGSLDKAVDSTTGATTVAQSGQILITGWAADPQQGAPVTQVQILIDGNGVGTATLGWTRADIATYYNNPAYKKSGWRITTAASGLSLGMHTVSAIVTDSLGLSTNLGPKTITVQ